MESQQWDLEENCPIDHEKIGGCHSNHKPKSCVSAPLGPDLQLIYIVLRCFWYDNDEL